MQVKDSLAIILAAGKGSRMESDKPKPLVNVFNRPILSWMIDDFHHYGIEVRPVINPNYKDLFRGYFKSIKFIDQNKPKGTGHAVMQTFGILKNYKNIFVFVGDSPFVGIENIIKMYNKHINQNADMTILSSYFIEKSFPYARIIRNEKKNIINCIEEIEASSEQKKINELFCSHYLFKSQILQKYLMDLKPNKINGEIYFTDIINKLINDNKNVCSLIVDDWRRLVGLNTKEDLYWIESQKIV